MEVCIVNVITIDHTVHITLPQRHYITNREQHLEPILAKTHVTINNNHRRHRKTHTNTVHMLRELKQPTKPHLQEEKTREVFDTFP